MFHVVEEERFEVGVAVVVAHYPVVGHAAGPSGALLIERDMHVAFVAALEPHDPAGQIVV